MSVNAVRRIIKELKMIGDSSQTDHINQMYTVGPSDPDNFMHWEGYIYGPKDTPYYTGIFKITIDFPEQYPFSIPIIKFQTKIFHPNISTDGLICCSVLKDDYSPALSISKILLSIISLLNDPNPDDPLNTEAGTIFKNDKYRYMAIAQAWTQEYAQLA